MDAETTEQIRRDVLLSADVPQEGEALVNWIVDMLVQAQVDLRTVSGADLKELLACAGRARRLRTDFEHTPRPYVKL